MTVELKGRSIVARGATPWNASADSLLSYHLLEEPSGAIVADGPRQPLKQDFEIAVDIPREAGDYAAWISPMREHAAWGYEDGSPFLLVRFTVDSNGAASLHGWRMATRKMVSRSRYARSITRAFTLPLKSMWSNRSLIRTLVRRDILSRFGGSFGGALWTVLNPLLLMATYFFVFGLVLHSHIGTDPSTTGFALYFLAGMLPWLAFSEALGRAPNVLIEHRNFIRKLVFPVETLPMNLVATGLVTEFFGALLFLLALFLIRGYVPAAALYLPLVLIPQVLLTAGVCWFLSALGVFVRDLAQVNAFLLTIWFFITPICYDERALSALPAEAVALLRLNPMYIYVQCYRRILLESAAPEWRALGWTALASVAIFLAGHAWFYKLRKSFADLI